MQDFNKTNDSSDLISFLLQTLEHRETLLVKTHSLSSIWLLKFDVCIHKDVFS